MPSMERKLNVNGGRPKGETEKNGRPSLGNAIGVEKRDDAFKALVRMRLAR